MAISIDDDDTFRQSRISDYFDGDSDRLDPRFADFKRINWIFDNDYGKSYAVDNLELADKFSIKIDSLTINKNHFDDLKELYKDRDPNLMIGYFEIDNYVESNWLAEDIEFINKLSPKKLTIHGDIWTVENINALAMLNWANVDIDFGVTINEDIYFWFVNTPIQLFDSNSDQMFIFEWESIRIFIEKDDKDEFEINGIEEVKLLKTNTGNFLFIPLDTIHQIEYLGFREISRADNINKQFADLCVQHQFKEDRLIIPMGYSNRIFIQLEDENLDYLNQCKDIYKIFKEKQIEPTIRSLGTLLEIKKLLPDDFSRIYFKLNDYRSTEIWKRSLSRIMNKLDWFNLKFINIYKKSTLSPDEFHYWCKMLHFSKTRFNLTSINLKFSLLSECLTVLSLCSGCPELELVKLEYFEADAEDELEAVKNAKREFRQKFGFIQKLDICKNEE